MRWVWSSLALGFGLLGCFTGTEVGNPEVSASVSMIPAEGWEMRSFDVEVADLSYHAGNDSGMLFNRPGGYLLDAADSSADTLPAQSVSASAWTAAALDIAFPAATTAPSDTATWSQVKDPGWVSFRNVYSGDTTRYLFLLPDSMRIRVSFDAATLKASLRNDSLQLGAAFDCRVWVTAIGNDVLTYRPGGADGRFAVLSPTENSGTYLRLLNSIPLSFKTISP